MFHGTRPLAVTLSTVALTVALIAGLSVGLSVLGLPTPAHAATVDFTDPVSAISYSVDDASPSTGATVTSYAGAATAVIIPSTVTIGGVEYRVTAIGTSAFQRKGLTAVTIPAGVTRIGSGAFFDNLLETVTIPAGVVIIEGGAFQKNLLTTVVIPNSVTAIGDSTFYNNRLTSVTISTSVTHIDSGAFQMNLLTTVTIPEGVRTIGDGTFSNNRLESVTIPGAVTSLGVYAFGGNPLTAVYMDGRSPTIASSEDNGPFGTGEGVKVYYRFAYASDYYPSWLGYASAVRVEPEDGAPTAPAGPTELASTGFDARGTILGVVVLGLLGTALLLSRRRRLGQLTPKE